MPEKLTPDSRSQNQSSSSPSSTKEEKPRFEKPRLIWGWSAPAREFQPQKTEFFITLVFLTLTISAILFLLEEGWLALGILAAGFVIFALNKYEPPHFAYQLWNVGLRINGKEYRWHDFTAFFIEEKEPYSLLHLELHWLKAPSFIPSEVITILFPSQGREKIENELLKHLEYREFKVKQTVRYLTEIVETFPFNPDAPLPRLLIRGSEKFYRFLEPRLNSLKNLTAMILKKGEKFFRSSRQSPRQAPSASEPS